MMTRRLVSVVLTKLHNGPQAGLHAWGQGQGYCSRQICDVMMEWSTLPLI